MGRRQIPVEAFGEFLHPAGVVQVMDDRAFDSILSQPIPAGGILLDFDHYSDLRNEDRAELKKRGIQLPSMAAGWIKGFVRKLDRIFADVDLTPEGEKAIANRTYLYTSPVHPRSGLEYLGDGKVRPLAISKVALTNEPNIKAIGPILANRSALALANSAGKDAGDLAGQALPLEAVADGIGQAPDLKNRQQRKPRMEQIAQFLGCEATEEAVLAAVKPLKEAADLANRAAEEKVAAERKAEMDAVAAERDALKNRAETAEAELESIRRKVEDDAVNARVAAELAKYPDLPNRAEAEAILRKDFDLGAKFLAGLPKPAAAPGSLPGRVPQDLENRKLTLVELCERGTRK